MSIWQNVDEAVDLLGIAADQLALEGRGMEADELRRLRHSVEEARDGILWAENVRDRVLIAVGLDGGERAFFAAVRVGSDWRAVGHYRSLFRAWTCAGEHLTHLQTSC